LAQTGRSWAKIAERIGWLLLIAVAVGLSWVLALRLFRMLLTALGG
jgi:hypothetical protein